MSAFPVPRPLMAFEGSFPPLAVHAMTPADLADAVDGLHQLVSGIPQARSVDVIAEDIRTTTAIWRLESLIGELEDSVDYRSGDPDQRADAFLLNELRDALAATDRFIGRLASQEAQKIATSWALDGAAGVERVSA